MNERLTDLEIRLEYQDRTIETLNEVVLQLRADLEILQKEYHKLRSQLENGTPDYGPACEKPPHY